MAWVAGSRLDKEDGVRLILNAKSDKQLQLASQLGCDGVMSSLSPKECPHGHYEYRSLVSLRSKVESYGLTLEALSTIPWRLCYKWMLGLPGRDEQIENLQKSLRNMGAAGIPLLVFNIHALRFYRTSRGTRGRGGALATSFDWSRVKDAPLMAGGPSVDPSLVPESHRRPIHDGEMWENYTYFVKAVVPVAEEAGVKLALHPDDPQVPSIAGVARIMRSPDAMRRALAVVPSENLGIKFCVGCFPRWELMSYKRFTTLAVEDRSCSLTFAMSGALWTIFARHS